MDTVVWIVGTVILIAASVFGALLFSEMIQSILEKDRAWFGILLAFIGLILLEAAAYSWLPGRFGYSVTLFEGAFTLEDGAVLSNLGGILFAQGAAIAFFLAKYLWSVIRKKERFNGKFFLLDLFFMLMFFVAGSRLYDQSDIIALTKDEAVRSRFLLVFGLGGVLMLIIGFRVIIRKWSSGT